MGLIGEIWAPVTAALGISLFAGLVTAIGVHVFAARRARRLDLLVVEVAPAAERRTSAAAEWIFERQVWRDDELEVLFDDLIHDADREPLAPATTITKVVDLTGPEPVVRTERRVIDLTAFELPPADQIDADLLRELAVRMTVVATAEPVRFAVPPSLLSRDWLAVPAGSVPPRRIARPFFEPA